MIVVAPFLVVTSLLLKSATQGLHSEKVDNDEENIALHPKFWPDDVTY